jgi:DNA-binding transcriptional MerR regulator
VDTLTPERRRHVTTETWKIGDLARLTGLSVRTLHHYDQIGLFGASGRTEAGHRRYTEADLERLQRIVSLRQLGFSLDEIRGCIDRPEFALAPLVALHLRQLDAQIRLQQRLRDRLTALQDVLQGEGALPATQLFETMEAISMLDKYLTPEQIEFLRTSRQLDPDRLEWKAFLDKLRAHMDAGDDPNGAAVQALADDWKARSQATVGANAALGQGLQKMLAAEPEVRLRAGLDEPLWNYMQQAFK